MARRIVQMGVMKTLSLARIFAGVVIYTLFIATIATMVVALVTVWFVLLRTNRCVRTAVIWTSPSVEVSAIFRSQIERIHIDGLAQMAQRSAFSTLLDAMGYLIVMIQVMSMIVLW